MLKLQKTVDQLHILMVTVWQRNGTRLEITKKTLMYRKKNIINAEVVGHLKIIQRSQSHKINRKIVKSATDWPREASNITE